MIISGALFGLAHYSGWDDQAWKVLATGIMGVFLGYLFVRFGLYAAILMHFIIDYFNAFDWAGIGTFGGLLELVLMGVGFVALIYLIITVASSKEKINSLPMFKNSYIKKDDNAP
jgi:membrane protease YdiL (CAAX protease family)